MERRVVVTGVGPVTALGTGKDPFYEALLKHSTVVREVPAEFEYTYAFKSRFFVPAPKISLRHFDIPPALENAMEEISKLSVVGTKLALKDAGFQLSKAEKYFCIDGLKNADIVVGVGMSSLQTALDSYICHVVDAKEDWRGIGEGKKRFHRMVIPMLMPNAASAWISILFGINGTNYTVNASCASGTCAIGEAYRRIKHGVCDTAITGGVECLRERNGAMMRGFDMLAALTRSEDGKPMPFSKNRSGFLFNEGAGCILILEELDAAIKRGANILAEICGYESNSDAYNIVQMEPSGEQITKLLQKLIGGRTIDYMNTHGTATSLNDEVEAKVIRQFFGSKQPLLNSTKGILGHSIGASGAVEVAVTALSIYTSKVHGNEIEDPMDDLNLVNKTMDAPISYAVSTSYGFGGHHAAILMKRYDE